MAAPAKNAVSTGKPKVAGSVYIGSAAAAAPADATTELGTGWTPLGYVGEDGVTNENSPETDSKKAWGGDIVLKLQTEKPDTFTFKLISSLDLDVLKAVYGDGNVSGTLADGITVTATGEELPEKQWVIDMVMRDNAVKRIYIPSGSIRTTRRSATSLRSWLCPAPMALRIRNSSNGPRAPEAADDEEAHDAQRRGAGDRADEAGRYAAF